MSAKILIADDEIEILEIMAKKISERGYDVVTASDGEEAWQKIKSESPDIIVLDLNMPGRNGFEVLQELRENPPEEKWQPVIIVSARTELEDVKKGLALEADHYLTKPCSVEYVLMAIKRMEGLIPQHKSSSE